MIIISCEYTNTSSISIIFAIIGKIPFDEVIIQRLLEGKSIVEHIPDHPISVKMKKIWDYVKDKMAIMSL